jgi:cell wall-associated NlpC family hydrolase
MKTITMTNMLLLASLTLLTACSNKTVEPDIKKNVKVSLENLPLAKIYPMVKTIQTRRVVQVVNNYSVLNNIPLAKTYPIVEEYRVSTPTHYVQSRVMQPQFQQTHQYVNYSPLPTRSYVAPKKYVHSRPIVMHYTPPVADDPCRASISKVTRKIEGDAKKLLGKKYVWGATGPRTYDCSGFTQKIYRDAGIKIPRVSRDQAKVGQYVSYNNLRKGDLVFFDTHKKRTGKVTHVGIYLGAGNFIHASSGAKKIVIFNFNNKKFYKNRFLWARRVVKDNTRLAMK